MRPLVRFSRAECPARFTRRSIEGLSFGAMTDDELKQVLIDLAGKCAERAAAFDEFGGRPAEMADHARAWTRITCAAVNAIATLESKTPGPDPLPPSARG